ncbi:MAG: BtrH N-terminal domain-containing protein [Candidatus Hodarchaeota archaeon]
MGIVAGFKHQQGFHCESTAIRNVLVHAGLDISEEMVIGLGEGLGFIIWQMKQMPVPFVGGGVKQAQKVETLGRNLGITVERFESTSVKKATTYIKTHIDDTRPLGAQVDMYYLPYFEDYDFHFAGHFVTLVGYDAQNVYVVDTDRPDTYSVPWDLYNKAAYPPEKVPMKGKRFMFSYAGVDSVKAYEEVIPIAIQNNANAMLNPPIKNIGVKGIHKFANEVQTWDETQPQVQQALSEFHLMSEEAGSGGGLFRKPYTRFLQQAYTLTDNPPYQEASLLFEEIHPKWTETAILAKEGAELETKKLKSTLRNLSENLNNIADLEEQAYRLLLENEV